MGFTIELWKKTANTAKTINYPIAAIGHTNVNTSLHTVPASLTSRQTKCPIKRLLRKMKPGYAT